MISYRLAVPVSIGLGIFLAPHFSITPEKTQLVLLGDSRGVLEPCGCTSPQTGGLKRFGYLYRNLSQSTPTYLVASGELTNGEGRQEILKAETLVDGLVQLGASVVSLGNADRLVPGLNERLRNLAGEAWLPHDAGRYLGPFRVSTSPSSARSMAIAVVLLDGNEAAAMAIAQRKGGPFVIRYRQDGRATWRRVGEGIIVSTGTKLRDFVLISAVGNQLNDPIILPLDEKIPDDPAMATVMKSYLGRVNSEDLLGKAIRLGKTKFVGTQKCLPCHGKLYETWQHTKHSQALASLVQKGHDRDPECVSCHVVGLDSPSGYKPGRASLAGVGCESCHAGASEHVWKPIENRLPKLGVKACISCHNSENSPNFRFPEYWKQIIH